ncbi:MAG: hypothetical protein CMH26_07540 [Micavibrio sp.]|nr:hypothetical protein [Micavibrio sp.]|tara:strand:+ start:1625 stop:2008 length:384 start_codon:yes stop_codon:yes gene_type:complete
MHKKLELSELRKRWEEVWGMQPHKGIGRTMLEKSLDYKNEGGLTPEQEARLEQLIKQYKRNPRSFDERCVSLKPGTRLIRSWKGKRHAVTVKADGFDYQGQHYTSLSQIANDITNSRWNGRVFFGVK